MGVLCCFPPFLLPSRMLGAMVVPGVDVTPDGQIRFRQPLVLRRCEEGDENDDVDVNECEYEI